MTKRTAPAITKHELEDWCHVCGKRDSANADVWFPENAEHGGKNTRYLRVCAGCALQTILAACGAPEEKRSYGPDEPVRDAETSYLVEAAARVAIGERGFAGIGDCLRGVGRAIDAAVELVKGAKDAKTRRVLEYASNAVGSCRLDVKDFIKRPRRRPERPRLDA